MQVSAEQKINFNMRLALASSVPWVDCPDHLDLMFSARHFLVSVDPMALEAGAHAATIKAYDVKQVCLEMGGINRVVYCSFNFKSNSKVVDQL